MSEKYPLAKPVVWRGDAQIAAKMLDIAWGMLAMYREYLYDRTGVWRPHADDIEMYGNIRAAEEDGNLVGTTEAAIIKILMRGETLDERPGDPSNLLNDLTVGLLEELGLWKDTP